MLLGLPGAGKGTQASRVAAAAGVPHIATGDMFRQAVASGSALGLRVKDFLDRGALVPEDVAIAVVGERLAAGDAAGFVLDGFPRTRPQADALEGMLGALGRPLDAAVYLDVPEAVVVARLSGRRVCPSCGATYNVQSDPPADDGLCRRCGHAVVQRSDDGEETQRRRIAVYRQDTQPLIDFYRAHGRLITIPGDRDAASVAAAILEAVRSGLAG